LSGRYPWRPRGGSPPWPLASASGGFAYVVDFSKASAPATAAWTTSAAGDVRNFSIEAYEAAKTHAPEILQFILNGLMALPPQLGAYDATAVALKPNMSISVELWMIYGGRGKYAEKCYMPGLVASIKLPQGGALNLGGNVLVSQGGSFIGFRVTTGFSLIASNTPVAPDAGPTQTTLVNTTLAKRGPSYDAALRAARSPGSEGAMVATAMKAALPFVTKPGAFYYIQCKASGKVIEIPGGTHDDCEVQQYTWTGGANQRFRFDPAGDDSYYIVPQTTQNKVFDVQGGWTDQGVRVLQYARKGGDNQKWQVLVGKDGWFSLVARHSGQALDVGMGGMADGNPIQQWGWNGGDVQQFRFIEAMEQDRWRWCKRCSSLFHAGTPDAVCAAGGAHDSSGSGAYFPFVSPAGVDGALYQDHWRWCAPRAQSARTRSRTTGAGVTAARACSTAAWRACARRAGNTRSAAEITCSRSADRRAVDCEGADRSDSDRPLEGRRLVRGGALYSAASSLGATRL
jgi:hypothetical protein